jgi:SH3 domain protein
MKRLMIWILAIGVSPLASVSGGRAESVYVVDTIKVAVRSGPGNDFKSIGLVESGNQLEVVQAEDEWSVIRLANGTEGYILSRYLTPTPPAKFRLDQTLEKNKSLAAKATELMEENQRLKVENDRLAAAAADGQNKISALRNEFEAFRQEASDFTALKASCDDLADELSQKKQTIAQLELQSSDLMDPNYLYWFLAGAGVLLVGFLTGFSARRQRRRSSLV